MKKITSYDVAHASFRNANQHCIISSTDKRELTITFVNGDVKKFPSIISLLNEVKIIEKWNSRHNNKDTKKEQFQALIEKYNI